jgi:peroxiredoxin
MKTARISALGFMLACTMAALCAAQQNVKAALSSVASRRPAPGFRLEDPSGTKVELSGFRGRTVVLNLWATECGGCKLELPTFVELRRTYGEHDLAVIGVSMDVMFEGLKTTADAWTRVRPFLQSHGLQYTILVDDGSVEKAYEVMSMPVTYLIDNHGRVAATYVGVVDAADLMSNVKALVAERE